MKSGSCKGARVAEMVHSPNKDPGACSSIFGVTKLTADFAIFAVKGCDGENIFCFGGGFQVFKPGLNKNSTFD